MLQDTLNTGCSSTQRSISGRNYAFLERGSQPLFSKRTFLYPFTAAKYMPRWPLIPSSLSTATRSRGILTKKSICMHAYMHACASQTTWILGQISTGLQAILHAPPVMTARGGHPTTSNTLVGSSQDIPVPPPAGHLFGLLQRASLTTSE